MAAPLLAGVAVLAGDGAIQEHGFSRLLGVTGHVHGAHDRIAGAEVVTRLSYAPAVVVYCDHP